LLQTVLYIAHDFSISKFAIGEVLEAAFATEIFRSVTGLINLTATRISCNCTSV
jgi:hypothetical protein